MEDPAVVLEIEANVLAMLAHAVRLGAATLARHLSDQAPRLLRLAEDLQAAADDRVPAEPADLRAV